MLIRSVTPRDAPAIASVHVASWRAAYAGIIPDAFLAKLSVEERTAAWRARLIEPPHVTILAEEHGRALGFANFGPSRDPDASPHTGELYALYVLPDVWGRRVGRRLWQTVEERFSSARCEVTLWVLEENVRARRFYERLGFAPDSAMKQCEFAGVVLTELRYRIQLSDADVTAHRGREPS